MNAYLFYFLALQLHRYKRRWVEPLSYIVLRMYATFHFIIYQCDWSMKSFLLLLSLLTIKENSTGVPTIYVQVDMARRRRRIGCQPAAATNGNRI